MDALQEARTTLLYMRDLTFKRNEPLNCWELREYIDQVLEQLAIVENENGIAEVYEAARADMLP